MSDKNNDRFVDELLDTSLARYGRAEAPAGLEERVLEELRARPAPPLWAWPAVARWQPVAVGMAVLALVAGVFYFTREPAPQSAPVAHAPEAPAVVAPAPVETPTPVPPAPAPPPNALATSRFHRRPEGRLGAGPRLAQFPAPAPLSEQERLLLRYAQETPPAQLTAVRLGEGKLEALRIEPLRIPPLTSEPN